MKAPMTKRQKDAFEFIERYINERGIAPTIDEIAAAIGLRSKSGVSRIVSGLVERGALIRFPNRARGIAVAEQRDIISVGYLAIIDAIAKYHSITPKDVIEDAILEYLKAHPLAAGETT